MTPPEPKPITDEELIRIWKLTCYNRAFELATIKAHQEKRLAPAPIYLSVGTEHVPAAVFVALHPTRDRNCWKLFPQHRCHSWFLTFGGPPERLVGELIGHTSAFATGMCGSASVFGDRIYGHSGLLGDQVPIAAGMALGSGAHTLVVLGDAACEEDYVLATFGFAASKGLPLLFVVEDNGLSILTKTEVRRNWKVTDVARSFGVPSFDVEDHPIAIFDAVKRIGLMPALLNIKVCRHRWHAGSGQDGPPEWDRYAEFRGYMVGRFGREVAEGIERGVADAARETWELLL